MGEPSANSGADLQDRANQWVSMRVVQNLWTREACDFEVGGAPFTQFLVGETDCQPGLARNFGQGCPRTQLRSQGGIQGVAQLCLVGDHERGKRVACSRLLGSWSPDAHMSIKNLEPGSYDIGAAGGRADGSNARRRNTCGGGWVNLFELVPQRQVQSQGFRSHAGSVAWGQSPLGSRG